MKEKFSIKGANCNVYANLDPNVESYIVFYQAVKASIEHY
jgi:hypothetical protein